MSDTEINALFAELVKWSLTHGAPLPLPEDRCWSARIDDDWSFVVNGTPKPLTADGSTIPPFTFMLTYLDWPAGVVDPGGAVLACVGEATTEAGLLKALTRG